MFPCPICDVKLNSAEQRRAHCRGKNHIKREEARKKAEELGTDFDNTPDHCEVCNVPLTSKMTAIDHFKGKMHQKKVKAVEDQKRGFKNFCDICEVRLQSLKVSEAHFQGKQHCKRERKTNCGKNLGKKSQDRKSSNTSRQKPEGFYASQNILGVVFDETQRNSTSWENLNCENEGESNDPFSEFRNLLSGKSFNSPYDSPDSSSSPESAKESFFSFETETSEIPIHENIIPRKSQIQLETISPKNQLFYSICDVSNLNTALADLWEESCVNDNTPFSEPQNGAQSEHVTQTQAVVYVLREAEKGISSGDIAMKIAELSPSDVNLILGDLEKHNLVTKSGYAPILWSLVGTNTQQTTHNGYSHSDKILSRKEPQFFDTSKTIYFNQNGHLPTRITDAYTTAAILSSRTTTSPSEGRPYDHVIEANLVNLFQQNGSLTLHEMKAKLNFRDEARLKFILHKLLEQNTIVKEPDQRWRLSTRANVGVIGEERKRRSPVQNEGEKSRTPTPPEENGQPVRNGFCEPRTFSPKCAVEQESAENGFWQDINYGIKSHHVNNSKRCSPPLNNTTVNKLNRNSPPLNYTITNKQCSRSSPPLPLKTETSEVLEDLIVTTPTAYQKELYEVAMQEDTVCYLPCGTGKDLVMAQVISHMAMLNPTKQALVVVADVVGALNVAQVLRKELGSKSKRKKLNVALHAGQLKQASGKVQVAVVTSSTCLSLLNCGALCWKDVCLLIFEQAGMCCNDESSRNILHEYYLKAKMNCRVVPKLLSFLDSSSGEHNLESTVRTFSNVLATMGDVFLSCVSEAVNELEENKRVAMFVCVQAGLTQEESRMFFLLGTYLNLVFDNLAAQWQPLNCYRELLKISFKESSVISEAFVKLIRLTGQPLEKRLPASCMKTWRHYIAICEIIFALVECGEDIAKELLANLRREEFGFSWASDVGLPGFELSQQLMETEITNWGSSLSFPRGSGVRELLEQLMIMQWENARVSSERPLALVVVKLNKTAKILANYLARCPELAKRNVKTTFVDGSRSQQQKAVISAIKRRQYQVIVSTDTGEPELPHCELVVLLDEPRSNYALEQLRTRRATNVVAICRDCDGEERLKELLRREKLVERAVTVIREGRC